MSTHLLEMRNITKRFHGVTALDDVNLKIKQGEIHALVGENGAGKSTLMNILSGTYTHGTYSGDIFFEGKEVSFKDIAHSEKLGIVIIHQELALTPYLSVAENMFIGNEQSKFGVIDWTATNQNATTHLKKLGLDLAPQTKIKNLGVGKQQLVEISKALAKEVKLLILDEPTAALNEKDSAILLNVLLDLRQHGITSILISHHLNEIAQVADAITILRDGKTIETLEVENHNVSEERIIQGMVGREIKDRFPKRDFTPKDTIFEIKNWSVYHHQYTDRKVVDDVSFSIREGEIVGIAGLVGAGRTELATSIFGKYYGYNISGSAYLYGKQTNISTIPKAIEQGIVYVTEDRKEEGLVLISNVKNNIILPNLSQVSNLNVVNDHHEVSVSEEYKQKLNIKTSSLLQKVMNLSGGNQQKVVLAKWMLANPTILLLDEPTRGIDVGAKYEIYTIINQLAENGKGCLLISSEMEEIIGMCDRVYVMSEGKFTAEIDAKDINQELIMKHIINNKE